MHDGNSPSERNFFLVLFFFFFKRSRNLKSCGGFFLMSLVLLWQFTWIGKTILHRCYGSKHIERKKKKKEYQTRRQKILFPCSSECNVQFRPYRGVWTCEKKKKRKKKSKVKKKYKWFRCLFSKIKQMCQLPSQAVEFVKELSLTLNALKDWELKAKAKQRFCCLFQLLYW